MSLKDVYSSHLMGKYEGKTYANEPTPDYTFKKNDRFNLKTK